MATEHDRLQSAGAATSGIAASVVSQPDRNFVLAAVWHRRQDRPLRSAMDTENRL